FALLLRVLLALEPAGTAADPALQAVLRPGLLPHLPGERDILLVRGAGGVGRERGPVVGAVRGTGGGPGDLVERGEPAAGLDDERVLPAVHLEGAVHERLLLGHEEVAEPDLFAGEAELADEPHRVSGRRGERPGRLLQPDRLAAELGDRFGDRFAGLLEGHAHPVLAVLRSHTASAVLCSVPIGAMQPGGQGRPAAAEVPRPLTNGR